MEQKIIEIWMPCPEYENVYEISNLGRLKSKAVYIQNEGNFDGGYIKHIKVKNQTINRDGYMTSKLCYLGKCRRLTIHRLVAKAFIPNPDNCTQVNHIDGNKMNNNIKNLEWVTAARNVQHAWETGLMTNEHMLGSKHHNAKVTEKDVKDIRANKALTRKELCLKYNLSASTLADILNKKTWKHVE